MIEETRIQYLNDNAVNDDGRFVVYWMQQSQREAFNPALEYAARQANALDVPLVAAFGIDAGYPDANERHFAFMLEGLAETKEALAQRKVKMIASACAPPEAAARGLSMNEDSGPITQDMSRYLPHIIL